MSDASQSPLVHVIDDHEVFRRSMIYMLTADDIPVRGYATGEEFLSAWRWGCRGVITLDINIDLPGAMRGPQIFDRLLALRCPMPIIFLTGPHGDDTQLCKQLVVQRELVEYFPKKTPPEELRAAISNYSGHEPALFERADSERRLLQWVLAELTRAVRLAMAGALAGQEAREQARDLHLAPGVIEIQRSTGMASAPIEPRSWPVLAGTLSPLMERMDADDLVDLASAELCCRLRLLSAAQQDALAAEMSGRRLSADSRNLLSEALVLMQTSRVAEVRKWLKSAGQEQLDATLARLPEPEFARIRSWLVWLLYQDGELHWADLPHVESD